MSANAGMQLTDGICHTVRNTVSRRMKDVDTGPESGPGQALRLL